MSQANKALSFEEDCQWSIFDQDAVPDALRMARKRWHMNAETAWKALQQKAAEEVVRAYRETDPLAKIDLKRTFLAEAAEDLFLFVAPA